MPARPSRAETSPSCMTPRAAQRRVLLVQGEDAAAEALVLQGAAQDGGAVDGLAVVREAERAGVAQLGHLRQRVAREAARDRGEEADRDAGLVAGGLAQRAQDRGVVDHRVRVGHGHDGHVAAGGGGARARVEVLLVLLPGHAQVHVRVDEAGHEQVRPSPSRTSAPSGAGSEPGAPSSAIAAGAHQDVERRVDARARVEHAGAADQEVGGRLRAVDERLGAAAARAHGVHAGCGVGRRARRARRRRAAARRRAARRAPPCGRRRPPRPAGR